MNITDGKYDVYNESFSLARKPHVCDACDRKIRVGDRYWRIRWVFNRSAGTVKRCIACQETHEHLRSLIGPDDLWPDERLRCGCHYVDVHGQPPPQEIEVLPFLTNDELQARY